MARGLVHPSSRVAHWGFGQGAPARFFDLDQVARLTGLLNSETQAVEHVLDVANRRFASCEKRLLVVVEIEFNDALDAVLAEDDGHAQVQVIHPVLTGQPCTTRNTRRWSRQCLYHLGRSCT